MRWIVVGAGSGGCVAAGRLVADPSNDVVLVESGPNLAPRVSPAEVDGADFLRSFGVAGRLHEGLVARRGGTAGPYRQGRGVGGSSAVNAMIALRGDPQQYVDWGWNDVDEAWERVRIPAQVPTHDELGAIDRALLAADPNAERTPLTRRAGRRVTAAEAYLWPVWERPNLVVHPDSEVVEVLLEGRSAAGVRTADGTEMAADRVVVAAGAIHSPVLLARSGVDVPGLGDGLQDHPAVSLTLELAEADLRPDGLAAGALTVHGDGQILALNHTGTDQESRRHGALLVALMRPRGPAGSVRPGSIGDPPIIELGPLTERHDLDSLASGVALARELLARSPFRDVVTRVYIDEHGTQLDQLDHERTHEWIQASTSSYLHATSTCAMGTVVGDEGGVHGYEGLYVCDASVFPTVPDVNTHLPTVMLAERLTARWTKGR